MSSPHRARRRFGQNFLHDPGIVQRILRAVAPRTEDRVVEIGPGRGALTENLQQSGCRLDLIELDRDLIAPLESRFGDAGRVRIHQADALGFDFASLAGEHRLRIVGNLPYNISTSLLFHLLGAREHIQDMHFMLQREVVQRLVAEPGNKAYGRLGIMTGYYCRAERLFDVPPEAFTPRPKVHSTVVRLTPHRELPLQARDVETLQTILRAAFNQRRKTLRNSLGGLINTEALAALGVNPGSRPEELDLASFVAIANHCKGDDSPL